MMMKPIQVKSHLRRTSKGKTRVKKHLRNTKLLQRKKFLTREYEQYGKGEIMRMYFEYVPGKFSEAQLRKMDKKELIEKLAKELYLLYDGKSHLAVEHIGMLMYMASPIIIPALSYWLLKRNKKLLLELEEKEARGIDTTSFLEKLTEKSMKEFERKPGKFRQAVIEWAKQKRIKKEQKELQRRLRKVSLPKLKYPIPKTEVIR